MSLYRAIRQYEPRFNGKPCDVPEQAEADYQVCRIRELQAQLVLAYDEWLAERQARERLEQKVTELRKVLDAFKVALAPKEQT